MENTVYRQREAKKYQQGKGSGTLEVHPTQERSNNKRDDNEEISIVRTSWVDGTVDQMDDSRAAEMVDETAER